MITFSKTTYNKKSMIKKRIINWYILLTSSILWKSSYIITRTFFVLILYIKLILCTKLIMHLQEKILITLFYFRLGQILGHILIQTRGEIWFTYLGNYFRPPRAPWGPLDSGLMMWTRMKVFTLLILFKRTFSATRCSIWVLTRVLTRVCAAGHICASLQLVAGNH